MDSLVKYMLTHVVFCFLAGGSIKSSAGRLNASFLFALEFGETFKMKSSQNICWYSCCTIDNSWDRCALSSKCCKMAIHCFKSGFFTTSASFMVLLKRWFDQDELFHQYRLEPKYVGDVMHCPSNMYSSTNAALMEHQV